MPQTMSLEKSGNSVPLARRKISASPRLRVSKKFGSREGAKARSAILRHTLIQYSAPLCLVSVMPTPQTHDAPPRVPSGLQVLSGVAEDATTPTSPPRVRSAGLAFATSRLRVSKKIGSRRGAEAQIILLAATTRHLLTFALRKGLKEARPPQTPRNGFGASTSRKRTPSAPPRLRANKFFCLCSRAAAQRGERNASMIQHSTQSCSPITITNQIPNPKKCRIFPAIPCPAGNSQHPRLAMVAA